MLIGYARVSTATQEAGLDAQVRDLNAFRLKVTDGAELHIERVFKEQASATKATENVRPILAECLTFLREGDILVVTKPDRLARNTRDLLDLVDQFEQRKVALIIMSMGDTQVDSRSATGKFMLTILGAVAEMERSMMKERQLEGIRAAQKAGKFNGAPPRMMKRAKQVLAMVDQGIWPHKVIATRNGMSLSSVQRIIRYHGVEQPKEAPAVPPPVRGEWHKKVAERHPDMLGKPLALDDLLDL